MVHGHPRRSYALAIAARLVSVVSASAPVRKSLMRRRARWVASTMVAGVLTWGCGANVQGPTSLTKQPDQVAASPAAQRAARVAATSACAQAFGIAHDAVKLRASYLAYEATQGQNRAQLVDVEKSFDETMADARLKDSSCSSQDAKAIRADLRRYQAGYFAKRAEPPKPAFDGKEFWQSDAASQLK